MEEDTSKMSQWTNQRYPNGNIKDIPMDTSLSIRHQFDVEIPRGKFVKISLILKDKSTWKLWHWFDVGLTFQFDEISMDFSMFFRRQMEITSVLAVSILSFSKNFCSLKVNLVQWWVDVLHAVPLTVRNHQFTFVIG